MGKPPAGMSVNYEVFMENPLVVIAPPAHSLSKRKHIPLAFQQRVGAQGAGRSIYIQDPAGNTVELRSVL